MLYQKSSTTRAFVDRTDKRSISTHGIIFIHLPELFEKLPLGLLFIRYHPIFEWESLIIN